MATGHSRFVLSCSLYERTTATKRREFLAATAATAAGMMALTRGAIAADDKPAMKKDIYELRLYKVEPDTRLKRTFKLPHDDPMQRRS